MNDPNEDGGAGDADGLDDLLDRGFRAAGEEARKDEPPVDPTVIQRLGDMLGQSSSVSLRELEDDGAEPVVKPLGSDQQGMREAGKYMVQGMLGQGGVGAVHRGHDNDLGRDVALKFLHEKYASQPDVLQRFVEEAQIGGQLQHPGIVPVYELGMVGGRPFFAMKMVKGQTLAQRLAERESLAAERRTFLTVFEQICQTMAYAHARGVVHRDLKPANVMIGSFGEVQVVDWGMGKVLERGGVADERLAEDKLTAERQEAVETVRSGGDGTRSVMGSVMGTPAYMPPEQARGDIDGMDTRSDVFALGAILCEMLSGKPPYVGQPNELLRMAAMGELEEAHQRLRSCDAEPELVELSIDCLAPAPTSRPRSAAAVAKAVQDHLSGVEARAAAARVDAAEARGREASLRRVQRLGVALIVVIAAGLMTSLWLWRKADEQRAIAERETREATEARASAETNLGNFNRLSHVVRLRTAKAAAKDLYPAWPERSQAMRDWLATDAAQLTAALPELQATLASLRTRALPAEGDGGDASPRFADSADLFLFDTLTALLADIEAFTATEVDSVKLRLRWSECVEELTVDNHRAKWEEARRAIRAADDVTASKRYADHPLDLQPQIGLVPIGMNPQTKLWEFYHLRSGWNPDAQPDPGALPVPTHEADGSIDVDGKGIVFVLIPGGTFWMGGQVDDPGKPNYDPQATKNEQPAHQVSLAPYFLARHEMTQGHWQRLDQGFLPSWYQQGVKYAGNPCIVGDDYPVEQVSWAMCDRLMKQHGLCLPTEAQWENGCRAGTSTPWATGDDAESLEGFANVLDQTGGRVMPKWPGAEAFDDHFKGPAPVGTYRPNGFGLYDTHGNLWEWVRDRFGELDLPTRQGDGLRLVADDADEVYIFRGGGFHATAFGSRVTMRDRVEPTLRSTELSMRAARGIVQ